MSAFMHPTPIADAVAGLAPNPAKLMRIDLETFSSIDLKKAGVYRYVEADDFEILIFGYKLVLNGVPQPRVVIDLTPFRALQFKMRRDVARGFPIRPYLEAILPAEVVDAFYDDEFVFSAFNAAFERVGMRAGFGLHIEPRHWRCTMVHALTCGLPSDLGRVANVLKTPTRKDAEGKKLIHFFTKPVKPTKVNGMQTRNWPSRFPAEWARFLSYNGDDVDTEHDIAERLRKLPMHPREQRGYEVDQAINDTGVPVDIKLVDAALEADAIARRALVAEAMQLTGLSNPNSIKQLVAWLNNQSQDDLWEREDVTAINKKTMPDLLEQFKGSVAEQVLRLRIELAKTSVSKYAAMKRAICRDGRIRGTHQFYGANRTGRWAGKIVQFQNMVSNKMKDETFKPGEARYVDLLGEARKALLIGGYDLVEMLFGKVTNVLSQLVRTAIKAEPGFVLAPIDFKAIEARGLAWKAGVKWRMDAFAHGKDIYVESVARMFNLDMAIAKTREWRQRGKIAELALGYQGGEGALILMGALALGIPEAELTLIKQNWRLASPEIPKLWYAFQEAALRCVRTRRPQQVAFGNGETTFRIHAGCLLMRLESGRELAYVLPKIGAGNFGDEVTYEGMNQMTKRWERTNSYGGKWVENWDQAFCRDLLLDKLFDIEDAGLLPYVSFHVHDEAVPMIPIGSKIENKFAKIFEKPVPWAPGLPLAGDGYLTPFYRKED